MRFVRIIHPVLADARSLTMVLLQVEAQYRKQCMCEIVSIKIKQHG